MADSTPRGSPGPPATADHVDTPRSGSEMGTDAVDNAASPALAVEGLSKQFATGAEAVTAVDDVTMTVDRGDIVGLLGPNGAGKTTLIKCILGMVLPDTGSVRLFGEDISDAPRSVYADVAAMLEGARNDYWRLTVRENLRYFATINGVDPNSVATRHDRLLEQFDLAEKADIPVRDLSRGMKQKASLASTLAGGARLLFLDEPTLGLDITSSRTLQRELRRLATDEGLTIVLSSHDMATIEAICDRVIVLSNGRIVADDTVDTLLNTEQSTTVRITSTDFTPEVLTTLQEQFEIQRIRRSTQRTRIELPADDETIYGVITHMHDAGVSIDRVATIDPTLEDVVIELTEELPSS